MKQFLMPLLMLINFISYAQPRVQIDEKLCQHSKTIRETIDTFDKRYGFNSDQTEIWIRFEFEEDALASASGDTITIHSPDLLFDGGRLGAVLSHYYFYLLRGKKVRSHIFQSQPSVILNQTFNFLIIGYQGLTLHTTLGENLKVVQGNIINDICAAYVAKEISHYYEPETPEIEQGVIILNTLRESGAMFDTYSLIKIQKDGDLASFSKIILGRDVTEKDVRKIAKLFLQLQLKKNDSVKIVEKINKLKSSDDT